LFDVQGSEVKGWLYLVQVDVTKYKSRPLPRLNRVSLFSLFEKNLEAHCFHNFLTDTPTKPSENSGHSELPDSSKTVKIAEKRSSVL
jgi:hypothetical protein